MKRLIVLLFVPTIALADIGLGLFDPGASTSIDTGCVDTRDFKVGCFSAMVEVESATTAAVCHVYTCASAWPDATFTGTIAAVSVAASSRSYALSVCPGTTTGVNMPLPPFIRVNCPAVAGVNLRGMFACH